MNASLIREEKETSCWVNIKCRSVIVFSGNIYYHSYNEDVMKQTAGSEVDKQATLQFQGSCKYAVEAQPNKRKGWKTAEHFLGGLQGEIQYRWLTFVMQNRGYGNFSTTHLI